MFDDEISRNPLLSRDRQADQALLYGDSEPPSILDEFFGGDFGGYMARSLPGALGQAFGEAQARRNEVIRRMWELAGLARREQGPACLAPYRDLEVAEAMLEQALKYRFLPFLEDDEGDRLAVFAEWLAAPPFPGMEERAAALRFRARCVQGRIRCQRRDDAGAEVRFSSALETFGMPSDPGLRAFFCQSLGGLRARQGRLDDAIGLLWHAYRLYGESGPPWAERQCRLELGHLFLRLGDLSSAMTSFVHVRRCLGSGPHEALQADLGCAACLAAAGLEEEARKLLADTLPARRRITREDERFPFEWWVCRISVHLGDLETAIPRLEAAWRQSVFSPWPELAQACLCALDLGLAYAKEGTVWQKLPYLLAGVERVRGVGAEVWGLGSLWKFREMLQNGHEPAVAARQAAELVGRRETSLTGLATSRNAAWRQDGRPRSRSRKGARADGG